MRGPGRVEYGGGPGAGVIARGLMAVIVAAAGVMALAASAAATGLAHPEWVLDNSPNVTVPGGQIASVSCSALDACTAVGTAVGSSGLSGPLAERWNGTSWTLRRIPNPATFTVPVSSPELVGVSCPAAKFCEAVGSYQLGLTGTKPGRRQAGYLLPAT